MNRETMLHLRDSFQALAGAVNLRVEHGGADETLREALSNVCRNIATELGLDVVELDDRTRAILAALGESQGHTEVAGVLHYLATSMADGVRRPGAWERSSVAQLFGYDAIALAEEEIDGAHQGAHRRA
jgi:uncharacterized protein involved in tellurium resistance